MSKLYYFSSDGNAKLDEIDTDIVSVEPEIGDLFYLYTYVDFQQYFPKTSYLSSDKSWCYINQYLFDIVQGMGVEKHILVGKVVAIL